MNQLFFMTTRRKIKSCAAKIYRHSNILRHTKLVSANFNSNHNDHSNSSIFTMLGATTLASIMAYNLLYNDTSECMFPQNQKSDKEIEEEFEAKHIGNIQKSAFLDQEIFKKTAGILSHTNN